MSDNFTLTLRKVILGGHSRQARLDEILEGKEVKQQRTQNQFSQINGTDSAAV